MADEFNDDERALSKRLATGGRWHPRYGDRDRMWFAKRMIAYHRPPRPAAYDVESIRERCLRSIQAATATVTIMSAAIVADLPGGTAGSNLDRLRVNRRLTQIIYGAIGNHAAQFVGAAGANDRLLDFVVRRRFRAVETMTQILSVAFGYPSTLLQSKVNDAALTHWEGITPDMVPGVARRHYPFKLSAHGRDEPRQAIENLFEPQAERGRRTLVPCDPAATAVHLRALLAASNPTRIGERLGRDEDEDYLVIDHPFGPMRNQGSDAQPRLEGAAYAHTLEEIIVPGGPRTNVEVKVDWPWLSLPQAVSRNPGWYPVNVRARIISGAAVEEIMIADSEVGAQGRHTGRIRIARITTSYQRFARLSPVAVPLWHVLTDPRPEHALFEQVYVTVEQLQVGDHVYLSNHPVYRGLVPEGFWGGEHSFITQIFEGDGPDVLEAKVSGHGFSEMTVASLAAELLKRANDALAVARSALDQALRWAPAAADFVPIEREASWDLELFRLAGRLQFVGSIAVTDLGPEGAKYPTALLRGSLGRDTVDPVSKNLILIDTATNPPPRNVIALSRISTSGPPRQQDYQLRYWDNLRGRQATFPLYWQAGEGKVTGSPREALYEDLENMVLLGAGGDIFVTRPRVDGSEQYRHFLEDIGAIPAAP